MQPSVSINIDFPSTVYIQFTGVMPKLFVLRDGSGDVHYFRYLNGSIPRIKFNMPIAGMYTTDNEIQVVKIVPIEIPDNLPTLPPAERDRLKPVTFVFNPNLKFTASINTHTGIIEHGPKYMGLIKPVQIFIDEHEKGHMFYKTEEKCDLFALVNFIRMGYNESTAYYALSSVIKKSPEQMKRVKDMFNNLDKSFSPNFNPGI